jgi:hypothetical protein
MDYSSVQYSSNQIEASDGISNVRQRFEKELRLYIHARVQYNVLKYNTVVQ